MQMDRNEFDMINGTLPRLHASYDSRATQLYGDTRAIRQPSNASYHGYTRAIRQPSNPRLHASYDSLATRAATVTRVLYNNGACSFREHVYCSASFVTSTMKSQMRIGSGFTGPQTNHTVYEIPLLLHTLKVYFVSSPLPPLFKPKDVHRLA
jgi:hypothetical protein